jgi:hypothetical protein
MMYGTKGMTSDPIGKASIVFSVLHLLVFCAYFQFIIVKPNWFGEFVNEFKADELSSKFYNIVMF